MHGRLTRRLSPVVVVVNVMLGACGTAGEFDFFGNPAGPDQLVNSEFQSFDIEKLIQLVDPLGKRQLKGEMLMEAVVSSLGTKNGAPETLLQSKIIAVLGDKRTAFLKARERRDSLREQLEQLRSQREAAQEQVTAKRRDLIAAKAAFDREVARVAGPDYTTQLKNLEQEITKAESMVRQLIKKISDNNEIIEEMQAEISRLIEPKREKILETGPSTAAAIPPTPDQDAALKPLKEKKAQAEQENIKYESYKAGWLQFKEEAQATAAALREEFKTKTDGDESYKAKADALAAADKAFEDARDTATMFDDDPSNRIQGVINQKTAQLQAAEQDVSRTASAFNSAYDGQLTALTKKTDSGDKAKIANVASEFHLALLAADQYSDAVSHRNRVQERLMAASQQACNFYKDRLRRLDTSVNFFLGSLTTVLGGVSPLFSGSSDVLGALAGVTSGVRSEFNTTYFQNLSLHVITRGIDSRRERRLTAVRAKNSSPINSYNTTAAVVDALKFHNDCTLNAGLEEASDALQLANNFRTGNVGVSEATKTLKDLKDLNDQVRELRGDGPIANSVKDVDRVKADVAIQGAKVDAAVAELKAAGLSEESLKTITDAFAAAKDTATTALTDLSRRAAESSVQIAKSEGDIQQAPLDGQAALREAKRLLVRVDNGISAEAEQVGKSFKDALSKLDAPMAAKRTDVRNTVATAVAGLGDEAVKTLLLQLKPMFPALKDTGDIAVAKTDIADLVKNDVTAFARIVTVQGLVSALAEKEVAAAPVTEVEEKPLEKPPLPNTLTKEEADAIMTAFRNRVSGLKDTAGIDIDLSAADWQTAIKPYVEEIQIALPDITGDGIDGGFGPNTRAATNPNDPTAPRLIDGEFMTALFGASPVLAKGLSKIEKVLEKPATGTDTHQVDRGQLMRLLGLTAFDKFSDAGVRDAIKAKRAALSLPLSDHLSVLMIKLLFNADSPKVVCQSICSAL